MKREMTRFKSCHFYSSMEYISLGKIIGTCGLHGEMKVFSTTEFGHLRYQKNKLVQVFNENEKTRITYTTKSYKKNGKIDYVSFLEINSINEAEQLIGCYVQIAKAECILPNGFYHYNDLQQCQVVDEKGASVGTIIAIEEFASQKVLRIKRQGKTDVLVPFVDAFIKNVKIDEKIIVIHVIEGLL